MRYIDVDKLIELSTITRTYKGDSCITVDDIDDCPTEDVAPVIHAKWIEDNRYLNFPCVCSLCETPGRHYWKYCCECGAKMDGKENDT